MRGWLVRHLFRWNMRALFCSCADTSQGVHVFRGLLHMLYALGAPKAMQKTVSCLGSLQHWPYCMRPYTSSTSSNENLDYTMHNITGRCNIHLYLLWSWKYTAMYTGSVSCRCCIDIFGENCNFSSLGFLICIVGIETRELLLYLI